MVLQGPDKGFRYRTTEGTNVLLGRSSEQMPLTDYTVSRRHAELRPFSRGWWLDDLKSANGTYLNDKRIERPMRLKHGDRIRMGATVLVWDGSSDQSPDEAGGNGASTADLIDLDADAGRNQAAILDTATGNDDSMILASPAAAEAVRSWRVMSSLLTAVGAVQSPKQLVERVMDVVFEEIPADRGFILIKNPKSGRYDSDVIRYKDTSQQKFRVSRTIVDHVIHKREGVLCSNAMSDSRFSGERLSGSIQAMGLQSVICVPIVARDEILGVIYIDIAMSRHIYTDEQLRLAVAIGQMAGLAIEDARLVSERMRTERLAATGETVAALSHYIKNILQGLQGGSDVVEMGLRKESMPTIDQGWQIVQRNMDKIFSLTMNMLAFAKTREPRKTPVHMTALVKDVLGLLKRRAADKGVLLKSDLADVPAIPMDEHGIHQVVLNIAGNAIDAVPRNSGVVNVKLGYDAERDAAVVTVGDNGPGISPQDQQRLFDAFYSTKGHGGTGLGLAVAKKIIDEHRGEIVISSVEGQGTLFRIIVPAQPEKGLDSAGTRGAGNAAASDETH